MVQRNSPRIERVFFLKIDARSFDSGICRKRNFETRNAYDWPGNIRELQNVIERALVLCDGETFSVDEPWLKRDGQRSAQAMPFIATIVEREKEIMESVAKSHRRK